MSGILIDYLNHGYTPGATPPIPTANLIADLDARYVSLDGGGYVYQVFDQSGHGNHLTNINTAHKFTPVATDTHLGGMPSLASSTPAFGAASHLQNGSIALGKAFTSYFVYHTDATSSDWQTVIDDWLVIIEGGNFWRVDAAGANLLDGGAGSYTGPGSYILCLSSAGTVGASFSFWRNSATALLSRTIGTDVGTTGSLSWGTGGSQHSTFQITRQLHYNAEHDTTTRNSAFLALSTIYGVAVAGL